MRQLPINRYSASSTAVGLGVQFLAKGVSGAPAMKGARAAGYLRFLKKNIVKLDGLVSECDKDH